MKKFQFEQAMYSPRTGSNVSEKLKLFVRIEGPCWINKNGAKWVRKS